MRHALTALLALTLVLQAPRPAAAQNAADPGSRPSPLALGRPAPFFSGWLTDGQPTNRDRFLRQVRDQQGQGLLLVFFATWCRPCRAGIARLVREADHLAREGIHVVLIDVGEEEVVVRAFAVQAGIDRFPVIRDPFARQAAIPYGAAEAGTGGPEAYTARVPLAVLLDPDGRVLGIYPEEDDSFLDRVRSALPRPPDASRVSP